MGLTLHHIGDGTKLSCFYDFFVVGRYTDIGKAIGAGYRPRGKWVPNRLRDQVSGHRVSALQLGRRSHAVPTPLQRPSQSPLRQRLGAEAANNLVSRKPKKSFHIRSGFS
jgi:hypothetical protein